MHFADHFEQPEPDLPAKMACGRAECALQAEASASKAAPLSSSLRPFLSSRMPAPTLIAEQLRDAGRFYLRLQRTAARRLCIPLSQRRWRFAALSSLLALATGGACAALLLGPDAGSRSAYAATVIEKVAPPDLTAEIQAAASLGNYTPVHATADAHETLLSLFARLKIKDDQAYDFIRRTPEAQPLAAPQRGQYISAGVEPSGRLAYLRLYMEGPHEQDSRTVEVMRLGEDLACSVLPFTFTASETLISGTALGSLEETARALQIPENVVEQLEAVWEGASNPIRDLKAGDSLRVIYEKKYAEGRFVRNGLLLGVQVVESGLRKTTPRIYEAFWFSDGIRTGSYFTLDGRAASQTFMRIPLDVKDISSEFAPLRRHPITGVVRAHNGTDMRAPAGSRVFAAADGRIERVAYERRGYGNYVKIDHGLGRTTLYAHMRKLAKGIRPGVYVKKGQVIGFVGMTGLATGPHLHYELMIDGVQVNPKTADLPDTESLSAYQLAQLRAAAAPMQALFDEAAEAEGKPAPSRILADQMRREAEADAEAAKNAAEEVDAPVVEDAPDEDAAPQPQGAKTAGNAAEKPPAKNAAASSQ